MNRTQIYLPRKQMDVLRQEAARKRTTVSQLIRDIIEERLSGPREAFVPEREGLAAAALRIGEM